MGRLYRTEAASGTTLATVIFAGNGVGDNAVLAAYNVTSDLASSVLSIKTKDWETTVDAASAGAQLVLNVTDTTGRAQDDVVIVQRADGSVERMEVDSVQAGVSLTMKANIVTACAAGDKVYVVTEAATIDVAAATVSGVATGNWGYFGCGTDDPFLAEVTGTSACSVNFVTVVNE